ADTVTFSIEHGAAGERDEPRRMSFELVEGERALAFRGAHLHARDQAAQVAVPVLVFTEDGQYERCRFLGRAGLVGLAGRGAGGRSGPTRRAARGVRFVRLLRPTCPTGPARLAGPTRLPGGCERQLADGKRAESRRLRGLVES